MLSRPMQSRFPQCSLAVARHYLRSQLHTGLTEVTAVHSLRCARRTAKQFSTEVQSSTGSASSSAPKSIFSPEASAWDHVFNGIDDLPSLRASGSSPRSRPRSNLTSSQTRSQAMTAQEIVAFDHMFDMIFNAIQKEDLNSAKQNSTAGVGVLSKAQADELYGKLKKNSRKMKWTDAEEEALDKKKEEINLCDTDQQLLDWAVREVFNESQKYTEEAQKQMEAMSSEQSSTKELPILQPQTYPHVIALLMRTFRDKYHDPHLALSIFDHARNLSIPSYVFGCSTLSYNELIQTRWQCFRDLKGVHEALEEMIVNGVESDSSTIRLLDIVRHDVGEKHSWVEECETEGSDARKLISKIDAFIAKSSYRSSSDVSSKNKSRFQKPRINEWKGLDEDDSDWQFDDWDLPQRPRSTREQSAAPKLRRAMF